MKNLLFLFLISILSVLISKHTFAQCDTELFSTKAIKILKKGFNFIRSYKVDGIAKCHPRIEYSCLFSKGISYMIRIEGKDGGATGIVAVLYSSDGEELASSYVSGKFYNGWTYVCKATGSYYLKFYFKDSQRYCGAAVLAFKR